MVNRQCVFSVLKIGETFTHPREVEYLGMAAEIYKKGTGGWGRPTRTPGPAVAFGPNELIYPSKGNENN